MVKALVFGTRDWAFESPRKYVKTSRTLRNVSVLMDASVELRQFIFLPLYEAFIRCVGIGLR